ncbi:MAG: peroxiredoxin [Methylovulum miyakonense]|uniref:peroxiredoxin n=1 Tax=Methylovulum miyakonense TaxID=645578 RepID=UPI003BB78926
MTSPSIGTAVPDFELASTGAKTVKFSDYRGQFVLLYFYPKDNTPGCTTEGQAFRDAIGQFTSLNTVILGVSRDSVKMHEGFKCKHEFPFDLLSDPEEQLCNLFDVIKQKNMYGKQVRGIERSTFLLDPNGMLVHEWRKVKVKTHCDEVLATIRQLKQAD